MLDRLRRISVLDRSVWLPALVVVAALAFGLPLVRRGIVLSDEGYLLQQALDLLDGRVLYRDMDAFITPGMWFLIAFVFKIFGPSIMVSRYLMWAAYAVLCLTGYRIVAPVSGRKAALGTVAALLLFSVWAFPAWTFAFYSPMAVLFALLGLERLLAWQRNPRHRDLLIMGICLGLSVCFKQNYGVFAIVGAAIGYAAVKLERPVPLRQALASSGHEIAWVGLGVVTAGLPFLAYLLAHSALPEAWASLVVHPFEFGGQHDIPYASISDLFRPDLYVDGVEKLTYLSYSALRAGYIPLLHGLRATHRLHVLAYWIPPLVFLAGGVLAIVSGRRSGRRVDAPLLGIVSTCGLVFLGVLPRADFNHLANVYQPVLIAGAVVVQRAYALIPRRRPAARMGLLAAVGLLAVAYGGTAIVWYMALIGNHVFLVDVPRGGVWVDRIDAARIERMIGTIEREMKPGSALLTIPDLIMLNFLTEHPVPSRYYNLYEHHISSDRGAAVVAGAERNHVDLVITRFDNFFSDRVGLIDYAPELTDYLVTHFEREFIGPNQEYIVYKRRQQPMAMLPFEDALANCRSDTPLADIRRHLLFSALYHRSRRNQPIPPEGVTTICRIRVPAEGGLLSFELGYLQPQASLPSTQLVSEISVLDGDVERRIHYEALRVVPARGALRQQPFRRLDLGLSDFAGREIEVEFRTRLLGRVATRPSDWKGFAMVYRDPRVQAGPDGARP